MTLEELAARLDDAINAVERVAEALEALVEPRRALDPGAVEPSEPWARIVDRGKL
jgi:hypothetical protein